MAGSSRSQIIQRKKRIQELIKSAYSSSSNKDNFLSQFPSFQHYNNSNNGLSILLESGRGDKLSSSLKQYIQNLLKVNMEGPFGAEWPEEEKEKRREMSSPEALYIFVYNAPSTPDNAKASIIGFVHYRFTIEEDIPVLYVYELQLEPAYQGKGLGKFLMQLVEQIACKNSMGAVVLTVQKRNTSAIKFYLNKLRYNISAISPSKVYQLMGVVGEEKSYEILCKTFDHEAKAVLEKRVRESGCGDVDIMKNALVDYNKKTKGKSFNHIEAWEIVRQADEWLEQPCVGQASSSHSDKRRKSSESGNYESGSNDNAETVIPDLNEDTTPTRKRKGKKTDSESSTKNSVVARFDTYMAKKTQLLETVMEKKLAKYELAEKLLAAQIRSVEEKALLRAMKFCNQPHNHITDPNMLAFTLAKKRELAEKYGWTCDF